MRRRFVWSPKEGCLVEIDVNARTEQHAALIVPDLPDYVSPVTGKLVSGRKQRREDLRRTNSRPWEGMDQELKESARQSAYDDKRRSERLEHVLRANYHQRLSPSQRRAIEGR